MTTSAPAPRPRRWWRRILLTLTIGGVVLMAVTLNAITLTRDARALSRSVQASTEATPALHLQGSVGPIFCALLRTGLRWVEAVPPEAHQALAALRGASVAIYHYDSDLSADDRTGVFTRAERTMRERGWNRTVAVQGGAENVMVFTDAPGWSGRSLRVCVAVCGPREVVIVDAKLAVKELEELVRHFAPATGILATVESRRRTDRG